MKLMERIAVRWTAIACISVVVFLGLIGLTFHRRIAPYRFPTSLKSDLTSEIRLMEKRVEGNPGSAIDRAVLASLYVANAKETGDISGFDRGEELAKASLKILPFSNAGAKSVLAEVASARHNFKEAIRLATEVMNEGRKTEGLATLATAYLAIGQPGEAEVYASKLIANRPSLANYGLRALTLTAQGRDEEAEFDFMKAIHLEDMGETHESARVRVLLGRFYLRKNCFREAADLFKEALRIYPNYHLALSLLGELEMAKGNYAKAENYFLNAFSSSRQLVYLRQTANAVKAKGDSGEAEKLYGEAEKSLREDLTAGKYGHRLELAQLLLDRGNSKDFPEAIDLARAEVKNRPSADTLYILTKALAHAEKWEEAKTTGEELMRLGMREPRFYSLLADIYTETQATDRARLYYALAGTRWRPIGRKLASQ